MKKFIYKILVVDMSTSNSKKWALVMSLFFIIDVIIACIYVACRCKEINDVEFNDEFDKNMDEIEQKMYFRDIPIITLITSFVPAFCFAKCDKITLREYFSKK